MSDQLFVLAEQTGKRLLNTEGVDVSLYEFLLVEAAGRRYLSLFLSRLDAELMRIGEKRWGNGTCRWRVPSRHSRFICESWKACTAR